MLRDKFAMAAMQGFLANSGMNTGNADWVIAEAAYRHADAMMKERAKQDFSGDPENVSVKVVPPVGASSLNEAASKLYNECIEKSALDGVKKMLSEAVVRKHNITQHGSETIAQLIEQLETGLPF